MANNQPPPQPPPKEPERPKPPGNIEIRENEELKKRQSR